MCFSAPASFTASAVLTTLGIGLLYKIKNKHLALLALIPLFFALQQASEGFVWLFLSSPDSWPMAIAKNIYLFFALSFWPIWVPLALWCAEKIVWRRRIFMISFGLGVLLSIFLSAAIPHMTAIPYCKSIQYFDHIRKNSPFNNLAVIAYPATTALPLFFSSIKKMWMLGIFVLLSACVIIEIDRHFYISMWCFFAALSSVALFFILPKKKLKKN